jgi:hypothetical protein
MKPKEELQQDVQNIASDFERRIVDLSQEARNRMRSLQTPQAGPSSTLIVGSLLGLAVGFVIGILTAPKSGQETRRSLEDQAKGYSDKGSSELKKRTA